MPLGKISKAQIAKGFGALEKIEDAIKKNQPSMFVEYSSQFYTLIPHNFGRRRPPTIVNAEQLQQKMDMLAVSVESLLLILKHFKSIYLFILACVISVAFVMFVMCNKIFADDNVPVMVCSIAGLS